MGRDNHLILFLRAPQFGAVKTRLAHDIGRFAAWQFYRRETAALCRRLSRDRRWRCWLAVTPDRFADQGRFWPTHLPRIAQGRGDLGTRMARSMRAVPPGPTVLVGGDIPTMQADHIAAAFRALRTADAVFGPATDGGYWLIGLRHKPAPQGPFRNVAWSTPTALADTRANFDHRRRIASIETLDDIDDGASWRRWRASRP